MRSSTSSPHRPYESSGSERRQYEELCGPIDEEISIPELVRSGTLCPHQDYVFAVEADLDAADGIRAFDASLRKLLEDLERDDEVPPPARRWWQILIRHYLFGKTSNASTGGSDDSPVSGDSGIESLQVPGGCR